MSNHQRQLLQFRGREQAGRGSISRCSLQVTQNHSPCIPLRDSLNCRMLMDSPSPPSSDPECRRELSRLPDRRPGSREDVGDQSGPCSPLGPGWPCCRHLMSMSAACICSSEMANSMTLYRAHCNHAFMYRAAHPPVHPNSLMSAGSPCAAGAPWHGLNGSIPHPWCC